MIKEIVEKWEKNKYKLEKYFKETSQSEYDTYEKIVKKLFELVINDTDATCNYPDAFYDVLRFVYNVDRITVINDGDYQGTLIFIIPKAVYQPSVDNYLMTSVSYGSCSGCDTLQAISDYSWECPDEEQVKDYMMLALHLVQNIKKLGEK